MGPETTEFSDITNYTAISPFEVTYFSTNRKLVCDFPLPILTYHLCCTISKIWLIIGQIFAINMGVLHFNALAGGDPLRISR